MLRHSSLSNHKNVNFLRTKYWKREEQRLVMVDSPEDYTTPWEPCHKTGGRHGTVAQGMETRMGHKHQEWRTTFLSEAMVQIPLKPVNSGWKKAGSAHKEKVHIWILFYPRAMTWPCAMITH